MSKFALLAVMLAACGTTPDERPVTVETVALGILAPTCGQVQCHSTTTRTKGYAFDTLEAAKDSLLDLTNDNVVSPRDNELIFVMTADDTERMPPDSPVARADIDLIVEWIADGRPGL